MTAIALSDVVYRYSRGGFTLRCPALELAPGELTLITGPNGSGKTTLSKLMCGILRPQEGQVRIFGHPAEELSLGEIGGRVGYLFQNPSRQLFASTVWQEMLPAADMKHMLIELSAVFKPVHAPEKTRGLKETVGYLQAKIGQQQRNNAPDGEKQENHDRSRQEKNLHESAFELDGSSFPNHFSVQQANGKRVDKHREKHQQRDGVKQHRKRAEFADPARDKKQHDNPNDIQHRIQVHARAAEEQ